MRTPSWDMMWKRRYDPPRWGVCHTYGLLNTKVSKCRGYRAECEAKPWYHDWFFFLIVILWPWKLRAGLKEIHYIVGKHGDSAHMRTFQFQKSTQLTALDFNDSLRIVEENSSQHVQQLGTGHKRAGRIWLHIYFSLSASRRGIAAASIKH